MGSFMQSIDVWVDGDGGVFNISMEAYVSPQPTPIGGDLLLSREPRPDVKDPCKV